MTGRPSRFGPPAVPCRRLVLFLVHRRLWILGLLLANLGFFLYMFRSVSAAEGSRPERYGVGDGRRYQRVDAGEFHSADIAVGKPRPRHPRRHGYDYSNTSDVIKPTAAPPSCSDLSGPPPGLRETHRWYPVFADSRVTYVFSAFLDRRESSGPIVRVVGVSAGYAENRLLYCQLWYEGQLEAQPSLVRAVYNIVPETHDYRYAPAVFDCPLERPETPYTVTLTPSRCHQPDYYLPVHTTPTDPQHEPEHNFTVCVSSPINFRYDDVTSFVENVETNRMFGADHFVFYNHTTGARLDRYLTHYVKRGIADVIPWDIPVGVNTQPPDPLNTVEIHYFGQVAALNDCLYRYMHTTKFIVFLDLDEIIVPRTAATWHDMMRKLSRNWGAVGPTTKYGAYMFRNTFFRIDWPDDVTKKHTLDRTLGLRTQLKLTRETRVWDYYSRSKCMVKPRTVVYVGIHFVFHFVQPSMSHKCVSEDVALLHHYRDWGNEDDVEKIFDPYMVKFKDVLSSAVVRTHNSVGVLPKITAET